VGGVDTLVIRVRGACLAIVLLATVSPSAQAIVNGEPVTSAQYVRKLPWAAVLVSPINGQVCGATLVSPTYLVTAGHCTNKGLALLIGAPDRRNARKLTVVDAIRDPRFSGKPGEFDIGLIKIDVPIRGPVVHVPDEHEALALLRSAPTGMILGWGHQKPGGDFSQVMARAAVKIARYELRETLILFESVPAGVCIGDSGGPLIVTDRKGRPVLLGVASVTDGDLCGKGGGVAGYSNVGLLSDFIRHNVPDLGG
jgi:Trypsin